MIPDRLATMTGLTVATLSALVYLVLLGLHQLSETALAFALGLALVMVLSSAGVALMFQLGRADNRLVGSALSCASGIDAASKALHPLSSEEEERLIDQLESELDDLERRCRQELTAMRDADYRNAHRPDAPGRL